jgi:hypothetical protein
MNFDARKEGNVTRPSQIRPTIEIKARDHNHLLPKGDSWKFA